MNFFGWDVVKKVLMVESLPVLFLRAGPGAGEKTRSQRTGSATLNVKMINLKNVITVTFYKKSVTY